MEIWFKGAGNAGLMPMHSGFNTRSHGKDIEDPPHVERPLPKMQAEQSTQAPVPKEDPLLELA